MPLGVLLIYFEAATYLSQLNFHRSFHCECGIRLANEGIQKAVIFRAVKRMEKLDQAEISFHDMIFTLLRFPFSMLCS